MLFVVVQGTIYIINGPADGRLRSVHFVALSTIPGLASMLWLRLDLFITVCTTSFRGGGGGGGGGGGSKEFPLETVH